MPPKQKITREMIIDAAFNLLRRDGMSSINARSIAKELNCSTQPIFSCFKNMEDLKTTLLRKARDLYNYYIEEGLKREQAFRGVGEAYIKFAAEEPELFKVLFMNDNIGKVKTLMDLDEKYDSILESAMQRTGLPKEQAEKLYWDIWILTHGIATMVATKTMEFSYEKIDEVLSDTFIGLVMRFKNGKFIINGGN